METLEEIQNKIISKFKIETIEKEKIKHNKKVLNLLHEACLIESYFALYTAKMINLFWYDVNATSIFTLEASEAFVHYFGLRRYLDAVGFKPVTDAEVTALRKKDRTKRYTNEVRELVNFMITEHFAAYFFADINKLHNEPVLSRMLDQFSKEEVVHSNFARDLLAERIHASPQIIPKILYFAKKFQHIGAYVLPVISKVKHDNIHIITSFNMRIEKLTGTSLSSYLSN